VSFFGRPDVWKANVSSILLLCTYVYSYVAERTGRLSQVYVGRQTGDSGVPRAIRVKAEIDLYRFDRASCQAAEKVPESSPGCRRLFMECVWVPRCIERRLATVELVRNEIAVAIDTLPVIPFRHKDRNDPAKICFRLPFAHTPIRGTVGPDADGWEVGEQSTTFIGCS